MGMGINWVLNLSDGNNSLLDISKISGLEYGLIKKISTLLVDNKLLKKLLDK